jgi:LMBR1 domain-containing protein 1
LKPLSNLFPFQCDTQLTRITEEWRSRVSIIVYCMAITATIGWVLFMIFGAVGMIALPMDWIRAFITRPRSTITRAQYVDRARDLARRAGDIK